MNRFKYVGSRLCVERIAMGMTQSHLAKKAKVSQSTIAQIETGRKLPSLLALESIATALGLKLKLEKE